LIIMGSRGLGSVRRVLMGSVSDSLVRHAHCPVVIVRESKRIDDRITLPWLKPVLPPSPLPTSLSRRGTNHELLNFRS
jgi:hypothetical protein